MTEIVTLSEDMPPPAADAYGLMRWLLTDARLGHRSIAALVEAFCRYLLASGVPLWRTSFSVRTLHPQIRAITYVWERGIEGVEETERPHGAERSEAYLTSPVAAIVEDGADSLRYRLEHLAAPFPYPILGELKARGATDYVAMGMPLRGNSGRIINVVTFASDRKGGFSGEALALVNGALPALSSVIETLALRRVALNLLDVYVGPSAGNRIMSGDIRRGTGETIRAVIFNCDLRGFTALADRLAREDLIALLNGYFEIVGEAVQQRGGEILKFIGDGMLAIFPTDGDGHARHQATRALEATRAALAGLAEFNAERAAWGEPTLRMGIALHAGEVMYGNIGAPNRLDFTVIGPAVNLVSRIEGLCKRMGREVLTSREVADLARGQLVSLGFQPVRGLHEPVEVFGLPEEDSR